MEDKKLINKVDFISLLDEKINDLTKKVNDISIDFVNDNYKLEFDDNIEDCIKEFADGQISIFDDDLFEYLKNNIDIIDNAMEEKHYTDLRSVIKAVQYEDYVNCLYSDEKSIIKLLACNYLLYKLENITILNATPKQFDDFFIDIEDLDFNDDFDDIKYYCDKFLGGEYDE